MKNFYLYISILLSLVACGGEVTLASKESKGDEKYLQYKIDGKDIVIKMWSASDKDFKYIAQFKECEIFDRKNWSCSREDIVPEVLKMSEGVAYWSKGSMGNVFK